MISGNKERNPCKLKNPSTILHDTIALRLAAKVLSKHIIENCNDLKNTLFSLIEILLYVLSVIFFK